MAKPKLKRLLRETYLQMLKNSPGSRLFRVVFAIDAKGKKQDVLKNGVFSCAFFVSSVLKIFSLVSSPHVTVKSTVEDMAKNGWRPTKELKPGNVLLWEEIKNHQHIGFYVGGRKAISNSSQKRTPFIHHFSFGRDKQGKPRRRIIGIFAPPETIFREKQKI